MWVQGAMLQRRVSVAIAMALFAVLVALMAVSPLSQWISLAQYNQEFFRLSK
jgi:hypothetical protein